MKSSSPHRNARPRLPKVHDKIGIRRTDDEFAFDKQIAAQLLAGRVIRDVSQVMLARKIGVTFQQIQKYETARNRISASRLLRIASALDLPPATAVIEPLGSIARLAPDNIGTRCLYSMWISLWMKFNRIVATEA